MIQYALSDAERRIMRAPELDDVVGAIAGGLHWELVRISKAGERISRWAEVPIGSIRRHDVKVWITTLMANDMTPATATRVLALFATSLAAAVDAELIEANPAARIKLPPPS